MSRGKKRRRRGNSDPMQSGNLPPFDPAEIMRMTLRLVPMMMIDKIPKKHWEDDAKAKGLKGLDKELHIFGMKATVCRELGDFLTDGLKKAKAKKEGEHGYSDK